MPSDAERTVPHECDNPIPHAGLSEFHATSALHHASADWVRSQDEVSRLLLLEDGSDVEEEVALFCALEAELLTGLGEWLAGKARCPVRRDPGCLAGLPG